jgi:hypothetical protein
MVKNPKLGFFVPKTDTILMGNCSQASISPQKKIFLQFEKRRWA